MMFHYWGKDAYYSVYKMLEVNFYDTCMAASVGVLFITVPLQYISVIFQFYFWLHERLFYFLSGAEQLEDLVVVD